MSARRTISLVRSFWHIRLIVLLLLVFAVIQGVVLWRACNRGMQAISSLDREGLPALRHLSSLQESLALFRLYSYEHLFAQEADKPAKAKRIDEVTQINRSLLAQLEALFPKGDGLRLATALEAELDASVKIFSRVRGLVDSDFPAAMKALDQEVPPVIERLAKASEAFEKFCDKTSGEHARETVVGFNRIQRDTAVFGLCSVFIGLVATGFVTLLARRTRQALSEIVVRLAQGSETVRVVSNRVSDTSRELAAGATEQAASLEQTGTSLEEMSSMTRRNAESAGKAKSLASMARQAADTGSLDMREMNVAVDAIKASSDSIAKIIKTIDEIAFQTNILALNAAVEAARAGESGAGFAVVADEVRNLAQRSASAARETAQQIEDSIVRSQHGVSISSKVAQSLQDILGKARELDEFVGQIADSSREQSIGIEQINASVVQMDKTTQYTAASAEAGASTSQELRAQAGELHQTVEELAQIVGATRAFNIQTHASSKAAEPLPKTSGSARPAKPSRAVPSVGTASNSSGRNIKPVDPASNTVQKTSGTDSSFKDF